MEQILKAARSARGPTPPCPARGVEDIQVSHPFPDVQCGHLRPFTELPSASVRFALGFGGGEVFRGQRGWGRWILPNQGFSFCSCCLHAILFSTVRLFSIKMCTVAWNKLSLCLEKGLLHHSESMVTANGQDLWGKKGPCCYLSWGR